MASATNFKTIIDALDEPSLLVIETRIAAFNSAAETLLGLRLSSADIRLVLRHPLALEQILDKGPGDVEVNGLIDPDRPWTVSVREAGEDALLVRLIDRSALRAAEKMRVDFVANASHELRTPLASIIGYSETIADNEDLDSAEAARFGTIICKEARRMQQIVQDLLSLSRIEADRFVAPHDEVSIGALAEAAAVNARTQAESRQCSVELKIQPDLPPIAGDQAQLTQLLDNLVANALRYGCRDAGCIVTVAAELEGDEIALTLSDTGQGIPRDHLPRLTERFYRVDAARSRDAGGTGLGLAIVKHIVERHRGRLEIRSAVGQGTEVIVRLPLR